MIRKGDSIHRPRQKEESLKMKEEISEKTMFQKGWIRNFPEVILPDAVFRERSQRTVGPKLSKERKPSPNQPILVPLLFPPPASAFKHRAEGCEIDQVECHSYAADLPS